MAVRGGEEKKSKGGEWRIHERWEGGLRREGSWE